VRVTRSFAILLVTLFAEVLCGQTFEFRNAAADPLVLGLMQDLAGRGAQKINDLEVAAFIVRESSGAFSCLLWPHSANIRSERYRGRIPAGTVAVAHTHPLYAPQPSGGDVAESKRIGLPIYVLTRWDLYVVDPSSGQRVALIERKNWTPQRGKRCECKTVWSNPAEAQQIGEIGASSSTDHR
jgi:hypothetical protein